MKIVPLIVILFFHSQLNCMDKDELFDRPEYEYLKEVGETKQEATSVWEKQLVQLRINIKYGPICALQRQALMAAELRGNIEREQSFFNEVIVALKQKKKIAQDVMDVSKIEIPDFY